MRRNQIGPAVPGPGFDARQRSAAAATDLGRNRDARPSSARFDTGASDVTASNGSTVLLVGGAGYLGSVLARELLERGYAVRVLDELLYGDHGVADLRSDDRFRLVVGDMRSVGIVREATEGVDAVVHLGGLVGDRICAHNPRRAIEYNYRATKRVAAVCKDRGIERFLFASSCSVYGKSERPERSLTEAAEPNPVSLYARNKLQSERTLSAMRDADFSPTILRMATLYGLSPRMRFDLVVNVLTAKAHAEGVIPIFGGEQYRPLVHVGDAARAYVDCLDAPVEDIDGETFNVGSDGQNYRIAEVGELIADQFSDAKIDRQREKEDERSYRVAFSKIRDALEYRTGETVGSGAREIRAALESGAIEDYTDDKYGNYRTVGGELE